MVTAAGYGQRSYRAYVPHFLRGWDPVLSVADLEEVRAADHALSSIAELPFSHLGAAIADWMAARDESIRSSIIEGVDSTGAGLAWARYAEAAGRPVSDQNDALTLGAARQTAYAVELGSKMREGGSCCLEDILEMHSSLFAGTRDRSIGGELRDGPIWVGPPGCLVDDASFVAPPPDLVPDLLSDLIEYLNTSSHPAVVKSVIAHAQFETIHPFADGNGRTGRALIQTVLNAKGMAHGAVPISTALSHDRQTYYGTLHDAQTVECDDSDTLARSASIRSWLRTFRRSCQNAASSAAVSSHRVEAIAARWQKAGRFRRDSSAAKLLAELPFMPVFDTEVAATRLGITAKSARRAIASLESAGIVSTTGGQRNRRYHVPDLVGWLREANPDGSRLVTGGDGPQIELAPAVQQTDTRSSCGHLGVRSRRRCCLPTGHAGQHRYVPA